jgi:hypothetical protein
MNQEHSVAKNPGQAPAGQVSTGRTWFGVERAERMMR